MMLNYDLLVEEWHKLRDAAPHYEHESAIAIKLVRFAENKLQAEVSELRQQLADRDALLAAVGQRADDSDRLAADLKQLLQIQAETAAGEIANLRRQLAEVQAQNERLAADLRWHEIWIAEHQERIERLTAERDDLRQQLEEARS